MRIRDAEERDLKSWAKMRTELWPDSDDQHAIELSVFFAGRSFDIAAAFMLVDAEDQPVGFLEVNIRNFAEGSRAPRLPYVEAWYVTEPHRGQGHGQELMKRAEIWAREQGHKELASDTDISNEGSIRLHKQLGFKEIERIVCFLKSLE